MAEPILQSHIKQIGNKQYLTYI